MMSEEFLNSEEMKSFNEERNRYLTELREGTEVYCKENKKKAEKRFDKYGSDFYGYLLYCINETNKVKQLIEPSREECEIALDDNENGVYKDNPKEYYKCSKCDDCFPVDKTDINYMSFINYCPHCGAKIKRGEER